MEFQSKSVLMASILIASSAIARAELESHEVACFGRIYDADGYFDANHDEGQAVKSIMVRFDRTYDSFSAHVSAYLYGAEAYGTSELSCSNAGEDKYACASIYNANERVSFNLQVQDYACGPSETCGVEMMEMRTSNLTVSHPIYPNDGYSALPITDTGKDETVYRLYAIHSPECQSYQIEKG